MDRYFFRSIDRLILNAIWGGRDGVMEYVRFILLVLTRRRSYTKESGGLTVDQTEFQQPDRSIGSIVHVH
jgi:hypothetical protein